MFLGLLDPDPDPLVKGMDPDPDPDTSIIKQNSTDFLLLYDVLSSKNDVNEPLKGNMQKNFFLN